MSKLVNVNPGMTTAEATAVGARNSWLGSGTLYFDPLEDAPAELDDVTAGSSVMTEPSISGNVSRWSKDGIIAQIGRGSMAGKVRDTRARYGDPKEWDHLSVTFSRDESARLRELGEAVQERMRGVIAQALREHPGAPDMKRQMMLSRLHDSSGNFHFHAILHRHAIKSPAQGGPLEASTSIDMMRNSEIQSIVQRINRLLVDAELGEFQIREAGVGDNDVFADRNDASRTMSGDDAANQADRGPDPGQSIHEQARSLTPSEATLKRMVELQNKKVADAQKALEEAQRMQDGFQNLLAAEVQKNEALKEKEIAEAQTEIARAAQAEAEEKAAQALESARIAEENRVKAASDAEAAKRDAEAAEERASQFEEKLYASNAKISDLEDDLKSKIDDIEERDERIDALSAEVESLSVFKEENAKLEKEIENKDKIIANKERDAQLSQQKISDLEKTIEQERTAHKEAIIVAVRTAEEKAGRDAEEKIAAMRLSLGGAMKAEISEIKLQHAEAMRALEKDHGIEKTRMQEMIDSLRASLDNAKAAIDEKVKEAFTLGKLLSSSLRNIIRHRHVNGLSTYQDDFNTVSAIANETKVPEFAQSPFKEDRTGGDPVEIEDPTKTVKRNDDGDYGM